MAEDTSAKNIMAGSDFIKTFNCYSHKILLYPVTKLNLKAHLVARRLRKTQEEQSKINTIMAIQARKTHSQQSIPTNCQLKCNVVMLPNPNISDFRVCFNFNNFCHVTACHIMCGRERKPFVSNDRRIRYIYFCLAKNLFTFLNSLQTILNSWTVCTNLLTF